MLIDFTDSNPYSPIEAALPDRAAMPRTFGEEMMTPVFQILDQFEIEKGLVLTGSPMPHAENHNLREGAKIEIRSGGLKLFVSEVAEFELMRNCWSPDRPRPMAVLIKEGRLELDEHAELWVDEGDLFREVSGGTRTVPGESADTEQGGDGQALSPP